MQIEVVGVTVRNQEGQGIRITDGTDGFVEIKACEIAPGGYIRVSAPEASTP